MKDAVMNLLDLNATMPTMRCNLFSFGLVSHMNGVSELHTSLKFVPVLPDLGKMGDSSSKLITLVPN